MDVRKEFETWRKSSYDDPDTMDPGQIRQLELAFIAGMHVRNLHILTEPDYLAVQSKLAARLHELGIEV